MWTQYGKIILYTLNCTSLNPSKLFTQITKTWKMRLELSALWHGQRQWQFKNGIHKGYLNPSNSNIYIQDSPDWSLYTGFKPLFWTKKFNDFQGHTSNVSRTPFSAKKSLESVFFGSSTTWAISSWRSFCVCSC